MLHFAIELAKSEYVCAGYFDYLTDMKVLETSEEAKIANEPKKFYDNTIKEISSELGKLFKNYKDELSPKEIPGFISERFLHLTWMNMLKILKIFCQLTMKPLYTHKNYNLIFTHFFFITV